MTAAHLTVAHCGEVSALTLGLPASAAIPEQKGTLPKGLFVAKAPVSSKLKQRLVNDIASITMLALLRPANTAMGAGSGKMPEVLVIGLRVNTPGIPVEVIDLIAGQRKSGIVFVCVHEGESEGAVREECALAVRPQRAGPGRSCADHESVLRRMEAVRRGHAGTTGRERRRSAKTMDDLWDSLCAQAILDSADGANLDARIARRDQIVTLKAAEEKLSRDHQRAKNPAQRNEIYAKLHKIRTQLAQLEQ